MSKTKISTSSTNTLTVVEDKEKSQKRQLAEIGLSCVASNMLTALKYAKGSFGELDITDSMAVMRERIAKVNSGDLSEMEATLVAQATTLDAVFNELARRAALNMGEHLNATETYLRLALKAQAQSRSTIETLAEIKYPKSATFVGQQNNAYQQQVNNGDAGDSPSSTRTGAPAHGNSNNSSNELLSEAINEKMDSGRTGATIGANQELETVGAINRSKNTRRKSS